MIERISAAWGRLLEGLAIAACAVVFLMMLMICADVLLRNVRLIPGVQGLAWSKTFTWERCADEAYAVLERTLGSHKVAGAWPLPHAV